MKKQLMSLILAGIIAAGAVVAVSAEETVIPEPEFAKGVVFNVESGFVASTYTGTVNGIVPGTTAGEVMSALENDAGIEMKRGDEAIAADEALAYGDKIVLKAEDGSVKSEFSVLFMGDVNSDSKVNISDVSIALKKLAKWDVEVDAMAADVNGDGALNISDASALLKKLAKWDVEFSGPVLPGKFEMEKKIDYLAHSAGPEDVWTPINLNQSLEEGVFDDVAVKFTVNEGEYATSVLAICPSWSDNKGSVTFSVYKWNGDYASTIGAMPIYTQTYVDFVDNDPPLTIDLLDASGKGLVAGEYLWRIHDGIDTEGAGRGVGIYCYLGKKPYEATGMTAFLNGEEFDLGPVAVFSFATAK